MEYGIPKMSMDSFDSIDPRVSDVPEYHPGIDAMDWDENTPLMPKGNYPKAPLPEYHGPQTKKESDRGDQQNEHDMTAHDDDMPSMSEDADDANPITPFHDVIRTHGGHYMGHVREGKRGEIRKNRYVIPNPKGGSETVELEAHQGGPDYGNVNSITHSGDLEATAPRVNNSPEKLDRNIHAQSYRAAPNRPEKMKPKDVRANRKFLESDSAAGDASPEWQPDSPNPHELHAMHKNMESKGFNYSHSGSREGFKGLISHTYKNNEGKVGYINERKSGTHTFHDEGQP